MSDEQKKIADTMHGKQWRVVHVHDCMITHCRNAGLGDHNDMT